MFTIRFRRPGIGVLFGLMSGLSVLIGAVYASTINESLFVTGNVGIGNTAPLAKLHVTGGARIQNPNDGDNALVIENGARSKAIGFQMVNGTTLATNLYGSGDGAGQYGRIGYGIGMDLVSGNFGIGTDSANQRLTIKGGGIGFDGNSGDKKLYSPVDGVLEWVTHNAAGAHGFSVSHQGDRRIFLDTNGVTYFNGGNVAVGSTAANSKLDVNGDARIHAQNDQGNSLIIENQARTKALGFQTLSGDRVVTNIYGGGDGQGGAYSWAGRATTTNLTNGNFGIGTDTPAEKLDVGGSIKLSGSIRSDGDICIGTCN